MARVEHVTARPARSLADASAEIRAELAKNKGMIASFSRALLEDLRHKMTADEFDAALASAIDEIYAASAT